ncbi:MAG TPA: bifunctional 3,4-dihydroxy-2-butanone-4-phosphate synthase/GTP cyclohydrolase II [Planctomycetota bacterium]|nr:bifunctional 3,4-dihydroxy-2-butanone-4-phosphate synthase/GTP cyclohydrolase II [Planctomycetota bacterium]
MSAFRPIEQAAQELRAGRMVVLVDDESRENEGDLVVAAEKVAPEAIAFMAKHGSGLICLALTAERVDELQLPLQPQRGPSRYGTAFTVSIEAREGVSTGISAHDRATTIRTAVAAHCKPTDLCTPGHVFPLRAREGGVLARAGQTEGSVDLCRIAGLAAAAVICEVMNDDGTMARLPELERFAARHGIVICSVAGLIEYRRRTETLIERAVHRVALPTLWGTFELFCYESKVDPQPHLALTKGLTFSNRDEPEPVNDPVLVRVHSECLTGDTLGSLRCDCGAQLHAALERIEAEGRGVLLYMRQEGRGIGLTNKLKAYLLQEQGLDTVEANVQLGFKADLRDYGIGAQILRDLGLRRIRLLTNNPKKLHALQGFGLEVVEQVPLAVTPSKHNRRYLETKRKKLGHTIPLD